MAKGSLAREGHFIELRDTVKYLLNIILISLFSSYGYSQHFAGEWKGYLETTRPSSPYNSELKIFFQPTADTSYNIFSYCRGKKTNGTDTIVVAKVLLKRLSNGHISLEETEVLKPKSVVNNCLVKMQLKMEVNDDETLLIGNWQSECNESGTISLRKKNK